MSDDRSRGFLQDVRDQNSRLQQLIAVTARLLARSQALLQRLSARSGSSAADSDRRVE